MEPQSARMSLGALALALLLPTAAAQGIISATTPATTISTLQFAPIVVNPSALVANSVQSTNSATINGVVTPLSGYETLARSGWVDTNGAVMGLVLVRARARVLRRREHGGVLGAAR
jgi:hypothetical protein